MRETGNIRGVFLSFSVTWLIQHSPIVQFYCTDANSRQFEWDNIFNKQHKVQMSPNLWQSDNTPFMISCQERPQAKCDREEAEFAAYLQRPFLLSSNYNCTFWEERIHDKSLNTGHELAAFCDPSASFLFLQTYFQVKLQHTACWKSFSYPLQWADILSNHSCSDRSCCCSTSKWLLCFHAMRERSPRLLTDHMTLVDIWDQDS